MGTVAHLEPIPHPPGHLFVGNLLDMDAMRVYYPRMLDIAVQLMQKWERLNPDDTVDVPADMTRLTLDTIALCGFNYRFNSLYRDTPHPFVVAMLGSLEAAQARGRELAIQRQLHPQPGQ